MYAYFPSDTFTRTISLLKFVPPPGENPFPLSWKHWQKGKRDWNTFCFGMCICIKLGKRGELVVSTFNLGAVRAIKKKGVLSGVFNQFKG